MTIIINNIANTLRKNCTKSIIERLHKAILRKKIVSIHLNFVLLYFCSRIDYYLEKALYIRKKMRNCKKAISYLEKVYKKNRKSERILISLCNLHLENASYQNALTLYKESCTNIDEDKITFEIANIYYLSKKYKKALNKINTIKNDDMFLSKIILKAILKIEKGEISEACNTLSQAHEWITIDKNCSLDHRILYARFQGLRLSLMLTKLCSLNYKTTREEALHYVVHYYPDETLLMVIRETCELEEPYTNNFYTILFKCYYKNPKDNTKGYYVSYNIAADSTNHACEIVSEFEKEFLGQGMIEIIEISNKQNSPCRPGVYHISQRTHFKN